MLIYLFIAIEILIAFGLLAFIVAYARLEYTSKKEWEKLLKYKDTYKIYCYGFELVKDSIKIESLNKDNWVYKVNDEYKEIYLNPKQPVDILDDVDFKALINKIKVNIKSVPVKDKVDLLKSKVTRDKSIDVQEEVIVETSSVDLEESKIAEDKKEEASIDVASILENR